MPWAQAGSRFTKLFEALAMDDIVTPVELVTDIMSGIATASQQQSAGIEQINQAVGQMDEATQQNAALVEQAAAAGKGWEEFRGSCLLVSVTPKAFPEKERDFKWR